MMKKLLAILLVLMIACTSVCAAFADTTTTTSKRPKLLTQPHDTTVMENGSVSIAFKQSGAKGITWRFYNPETKEKILASKAADYFPGIRISGQNSVDLRLRKVPLSLDGWQVYCTLTNSAGSTATQKVTITVTPSTDSEVTAEEEASSEDTGDTAEDNEEEEPAKISVADNNDGVVTVTAIGCTLSDGSTSGAETLDFSGSASFTVKTTKSTGISYWVINGVKYKFNKTVKSIAIRDLSVDTTFEVVYKGGTSKTLLSDEELAVQGDDLLVAQTSNAKMCFIKKNGTGAGGYFKELDFTGSYRNKATKKTMPGGYVSLKVKAVIPSGKKIAYWLFNGARFDFNSNVTSFNVFNLNVAMDWEARFETGSDADATATPAATSASGAIVVTGATATPAPASATATPAATSSNEMCTVRCSGCTFSGGGYTNATSGEVAKGTAITLTPSTMYGIWSGSYNASAGGFTTPTVSVTKNSTYTWTDAESSEY